MAKLPPALVCKDSVRDQPGLLHLGVVHAGVGLPDFSAWEARQGEVGAAQQQMEKSEWTQGAWEDSGIFVGHVYLASRCP